MSTLPEKLTIEQLRAIIAVYEKPFAMIGPIDYGYLAAKELLAVKEALSLPAGTQLKPVADLYEMKFEDGHTCAFHTDAEKAIQWLNTCDGNKVQEYVKLERLQDAFTAPPAPAVSADVAAALDWIDDFIARCNGDDRGACNSVNVLRAAMLQPVSQGYMLNSPVIPDGWKLVPIVELTEKMVIHGFESEAFEALADAVQDEKGWPYSCRESAECVTGIFKAMVEVAPSPGGSDDSHATAT